METCEVCGKKSEYNGLVWYSGPSESFLCRTHHRLWLVEHRAFEKKYGECGGRKVLCYKLQVLFLQWLKRQKSERGANG